VRPNYQTAALPLNGLRNFWRCYRFCYQSTLFQPPQDWTLSPEPPIGPAIPFERLPNEPLVTRFNALALQQNAPRNTPLADETVTGSPLQATATLRRSAVAIKFALRGFPFMRHFFSARVTLPVGFGHLAYPRLQCFNGPFYGVRRFFFALTDVSRSHPPGRRMYPGAQPEGNMEAPLESPLEKAPQKAPPSRCASTSFKLSSTRRANSRPATGTSKANFVPFSMSLLCSARTVFFIRFQPLALLILEPIGRGRW
jgi:hypothetical protein